MEITINHQKKFFEELPSSLEALMQLTIPEVPRGIAVALNNQVVPRDQWASKSLRENDTILIITATQGG
ncbi:sulfur carrier protein ThiS [Sphingobacterium wenxiniae]|nr:sulfur carrier protein ThiS [Sphingobacterium wenxiniae]